MQRITQFIICFLVTASVAEASIMIPLSKKYPIKSHNNIRVKIFPHSKNYRPHGKDQNKKSVMLSSTGLCDIYLGESYRTGKTSSLLKKNQKYINITAKDLRDSPGGFNVQAKQESLEMPIDLILFMQETFTPESTIRVT